MTDIKGLRALVASMESQLMAWDIDEPRYDWWNYQRQYLEASEALPTLLDQVETQAAEIARLRAALTSITRGGNATGCNPQLMADEATAALEGDAK